jgi:hypothetical protein
MVAASSVGRLQTPRATNNTQNRPDATFCAITLSSRRAFVMVRRITWWRAAAATVA